MARFLFAAWPFPGHLFPQIALAHALRARGHDCAFYTGEQTAPVVRDEGFPVFPFRHVDEAALDRLMRSRPAEPWRPSNGPRVTLMLRKWLLDTVPAQVRDLQEAVATWRPHVIGSDPTMWAPMLVLAEMCDVEVAVCSFIPACPLPGPDAPPFGPGLPRPVDWSGAVAASIARFWARVSGRMGRRAINEIRKTYRLPPVTLSATACTGRMPLYLVPCTAKFDYGRRDLPSSVHYVGPYSWNRPRSDAASSWVAELRRPCVHVTEGTMHVHTPVLLRAALTGLADLPIQVVITTGGHRTLDDLGARSVAANIRVEQWVSHSELLPHVDAVVTTGGAGSVLATLAAGVPLVVVPTEWDKPEIAQRVVEAGAGIRLAPRHCTPQRLRESVLEVLGTPAFTQRARRLAESFARSGGAERAADLLIALSRRRCDITSPQARPLAV